MAHGVANSDFVPDPFPGIHLPSGTGAPGSRGADPADTSGPVIGTVGIPDGDTYQSGQVPRTMVAVTSGDTSGFSDDKPVHSSPLLPGPESDYMASGPMPNAVVSASEHGRYPWQSKAGG